MKKRVVLLDAAQVSTVLKYAGLKGLDVIAGRGDYFFYSKDFREELKASGWLDKKNGRLFLSWIEKNQKRLSGHRRRSDGLLRRNAWSEAR